jgi:hypothetical protein
MVPPGFKAALVTYADAKGALGLQQISDEFDTLFARITQRRGKELVTSSINGKACGFQVNCTVEELFAVFGEALRDISGDRIVCTNPDFSQLQR